MLISTNIPRITIGALKGGAGKTFISLGITGALRKQGLSPAIFKKGPDYIDAGWLGMAAGSCCHNLDSYLFESEVVRSSFITNSAGKDIAVIEGNRGLFDGVDSQGHFSTAELARLLRSPVILVIDATKMTRTAAALVLGCRELDHELNLQGIILNRVAGARHEKILRESIEATTGIPIVGSINKLSLEDFPQRHLGLLPLYEHPRAEEFLTEAIRIIASSVDLDKILSIAGRAPKISGTCPSKTLPDIDKSKGSTRIGILKDTAFQFYYPENLEALSKGGGQVIEISALRDSQLPEIDGLYIGGGFPETHAEALANNHEFKKSVLNAARSGMPIYAECGGLIYLSKTLRIDNRVYPMVGIFPVDAVLERKPQGHGYLQVEVTGSNPFYPLGKIITGHEFHYSYLSGLDITEDSYAFRVLRGYGIDGIHDGIAAYNAIGTYLHVHALGEPLWAEGILRKASEFQLMKTERHENVSKTVRLKN